MKIIKKLWGLIPISFFLLLKIVLFIIEKSANVVLRDIPDCIMFWFFILSTLLLIIYIIINLFSWNRIKKHKSSHILKNISIFLYAVGVLISFGIGLLYTALSCHPEDVVIENGMKMVTRDTSFLDFRMEYYKYKNILFRGKQTLKLISNRTYWIYDSNGKLLGTGVYYDN